MGFRYRAHNYSCVSHFVVLSIRIEQSVGEERHGKNEYTELTIYFLTAEIFLIYIYIKKREKFRKGNKNFLSRHDFGE